jgi:hypothetical protein
VVGIPLTVDLFRGSTQTESQYQTWKVLHGYAVFVAFVNFFFGYCIDQQNLTRRQMEIASWSFLVAGVAGGFGRPVLFLLSMDGGVGSYLVSLIETAGFALGTFVFVYGLTKERPAKQLARSW